MGQDKGRGTNPAEGIPKGGPALRRALFGCVADKIGSGTLRL